MNKLNYAHNMLQLFRSFAGEFFVKNVIIINGYWFLDL